MFGMREGGENFPFLEESLPMCFGPSGVQQLDGGTLA